MKEPNLRIHIELNKIGKGTNRFAFPVLLVVFEFSVKKTLSFILFLQLFLEKKYDEIAKQHKFH